MALNLANVALTDTFNTWRVRTNDIISEAVSANSSTPTTITTITTFVSNTTIGGSNTTITSNAVFTGSNVDFNVSNLDIIATVDINNSKIRIVDNDMTITGELTANSFTGDGSALTSVDAETLDSIDSASFLRSDVADVKTSGDLTFNDNIKALFGTAGDLEIFHSGSASLINDAGGGNLKLQLAGSDKLEITSGGIEVTGEVQGTTLDINGAASIAGAVTDVTTLTASGEIQGGSLDINGNASIAGTLSDVTTLTATTFSGSGASLTSLNASQLSSGTIPDGRFPSQLPAVDGSQLTGISAGATVTDKSDNVDYNIVFTNETTGTQSLAGIDTGAFIFNPSTGTCSATVFNATSDERVKDNITQISNALEKVLQLDGVDFTWKKSGLESTGLIAQQVEQVIPQVVTEDSDGMKGVNYGALVGVLIEAIKELNEKLEK